VTDRGTYLYAVTRAPAVTPDVAALDNGTIRLVEHRDLVAVVSGVDLADYGEQGLRTHLEDIRWLERVARGHDAVVAAVAASGPVAPFRLATVFFDDVRMRARLDECYPALLRALERVEGRMEWSVKAVVPQVGEGGDVAADSPPPQLSGADYLARKRDAKQQREAAADRGAALGDTLHQTLSSTVVASRRLPAQDVRLTGHKGTMVLNAAYLVDNEAAQAFTDLVAELRSQNPEAVVEAHGPWPPYSFATLDDP